MREKKRGRVRTLVPCETAICRTKGEVKIDQERRRKERQRERERRRKKTYPDMQDPLIHHASRHSNRNLTPSPTPNLRPSLTRPNRLNSALRRSRHLTHTIRRSNGVIIPRLRRVLRRLRVLRVSRMMRVMRMTRPTRATPTNLADRIIRGHIRVDVDVDHALWQEDMARRDVRSRRLAGCRAVV